VNALVCEAARAAGALVNDAETPARGDFVVPSVVRRGDLLIAVTTQGASPALAARIQERLSEQFGEEYGPYVALLAEVRERVMETIPDPAQRRRILRAAAADAEILELIRGGRLDAARARAFACISSLSD
jgi:precorrin-2 dehydrogenase/sirohydrochlorin ferrochelatase